MLGKRELRSYLRIATELGYMDRFPDSEDKLRNAKNSIEADRIMHDCRENMVYITDIVERKNAMAKRVQCLHNGKTRNITDFRVENGIVSGRISGRQLSVPMDNSYVYKTGKCATEKSKAIHFLIDYYDQIDGRTMTKKESGVFGSVMKQSVIKNTHVERLSDGISEATAMVYDVPVTIQFKGEVRNLDTGEVGDGKPWLRPVREQLIAAYDRLPEEQKVPKEQTMMEFVDAERKRIDGLNSTHRVDEAFINRLRSESPFNVVTVDGVPVAIYENQIINLGQKRYGKKPVLLGKGVAIDLLTVAYQKVQTEIAELKRKEDEFFEMFA